MPANLHNMPGLADLDVEQSRMKYGANQLSYKKDAGWLYILKELLHEPMILLLFCTATIYLFTGNTGDAIFLAAAIVLVAAISLYQDARSRNALEKLKRFSQPVCTVIRNGRLTSIKSEEVVIGDALVVEEGAAIAADGTILQANDFSVNESILTGESFPVSKDQHSQDRNVYMGTTVSSGLAVVTVTAIGNATQLGKIGKSLETIESEKTPLELQVNNFVKKMVMLGAIIFLLVWALNYFRSYSLTDSLLKALTLAMSILPEEIPVAFTTFMAMGAWRLMKMGIVVKQIKTVEALGSATVICTDKTGTLTENKMSLAKIFTTVHGKISELPGALLPEEEKLITLAMWASEPIPFDPMEKALHAAYQSIMLQDERLAFKMIHEYPLSGHPPMMTHVFEDATGRRIIAAKGAPEAIIHVCNLSATKKRGIASAIDTLSADGYRILAVGEAAFAGTQYPLNQQELLFSFAGLVAFYDPPKADIQQTLQGFYAAGIDVKIVTGDSGATTNAIARQIHFKDYLQSTNGAELMQLKGHDLTQKIMASGIFTRMFPEAKLQIIQALQSQQQVVAMIGDGVNDAPALKAANIGIAMGRKGTEIAKGASALILLEDDLSKLLDAIAMGRRIYSNLKKAIRYIISIHIPIVLTVFIPLALGWLYPAIFTPVHIIFFELVMGPTCSIIYEHEPMEENMMLQKPRPYTSTFFNWQELSTSFLQGLVITAGALAVYQYAVHQGCSENVTRAMVFICLIAANICLTLVNRSFYYSFITSFKYKNTMLVMMVIITIILTGIMMFITPVANFFSLQNPGMSNLLICTVTGGISAFWYEGVKWLTRRKHANTTQRS